MAEQGLVRHELEIYTSTLRWKGSLFLPPFRRLSDFLNDNTREFVGLNQVELAELPLRGDGNARRGESGPDKAVSTPGMSPEPFPVPSNLEVVAIGKHSIIAIIVTSVPSLPPTSSGDRIPKIARRMMIHTPPLGLVACTYFARDVRWQEALDALRLDFISVTDATIWSPQSGELIGSHISFSMIGRRWITGVYPIEGNLAPGALQMRGSHTQ